MASPGGAPESVHQVKTITFKGRRVPIMLQDVNGPCPLLAIANVLLLRGQLALPAGVGEVSQARLVEMVAGHLLDANSLEGPRAAALSEEQRASLAHNLADSISLLPKLCTGIDVNPRFHTPLSTGGAFEYTPETAVFDLLDIALAHGWLVDPQDEATTRAVGQRSYNELVVQLITTLGSAATPKQLTPTGSLHRAEADAAAGAAAGAAVQQVLQAQQAQQAGQKIDADQLSAALRETLRVSVTPHRDADAAGSGPASARSAGGGGGGVPEQPHYSRATSTASIQTNDSMHSFVGRLINDVTADAFLATPTTSRFTHTSSGMGGAALAAAECEGEEATSGLQPRAGDGSGGGGTGLAPLAIAEPAESWRVELSLDVDAAAAEEQAVRVQLAVVQAPLPPSPFAGGGAAAGGQRSTPVTPHPSAASLNIRDADASSGAVRLGPSRLQQAGGSSGAGGAVPAAAGAPGSGVGSPGEAAVRDALLAQQFLDGHSSQLTYHGLTALQEALRPNQLAVFFRNNHFSTLYKDGDSGGLFLLATDEGWQYEADVVWEHLVCVDGDTSLVDAAFRPFQPHAEAGAGARAGAGAAAAAHGGVDPEWAAATAAAGEHTSDSDLALAMQLQAEEEERAAAEQQRRAAAAARQQEEQRRQAQAQAQVLPSQRRPGSGSSTSSSGGGSGGVRKKKDKRSSDSACCVM